MKIILKREVKSFSKGLTFKAGEPIEAEEEDGFIYALQNGQRVHMAKGNIKSYIGRTEPVDLSTKTVHISTLKEVKHDMASTPGDVVIVVDDVNQELSSSTLTQTQTNNSMTKTKVKPASSRAKKPAKKATAKKAPAPKKDKEPVDINTITDPVERLNIHLRQIATKSGFDEVAKQVAAAGLKFLKRNGGQVLTFKEHAISKKRGNKALLIFETKDGDTSKAVLEVASRFIEIGK